MSKKTNNFLWTKKSKKNILKGGEPPPRPPPTRRHPKHGGSAPLTKGNKHPAIYTPTNDSKKNLEKLKDILKNNWEFLDETIFDDYPDEMKKERDKILNEDIWTTTFLENYLDVDKSFSEITINDESTTNKPLFELCYDFYFLLKKISHWIKEIFNNDTKLRGDLSTKNIINPNVLRGDGDKKHSSYFYKFKSLVDLETDHPLFELKVLWNCFKDTKYIKKKIEDIIYVNNNWEILNLNKIDENPKKYLIKVYGPNNSGQKFHFEQIIRKLKLDKSNVIKMDHEYSKYSLVFKFLLDKNIRKLRIPLTIQETKLTNTYLYPLFFFK